MPQNLRDRAAAAEVRLARPAAFIPGAGLAHTYASASAAALAEMARSAEMALSVMRAEMARQSKRSHC